MKRILLLAFMLSAPICRAQSPMLVVTSLDGDSVHLYSIKGTVPRLLKAVTVGKAPAALCLDPNGSRAFVSVTGDKQVAVVDLNKQEKVATLSAPGMQWPDGCAVSPDSKKVYVTDSRADVVDIFSTESNQLLKQMVTGKEPTRALFSPDGKRLLIANADSKTLSVINPATDAIVQTVKTGTEPHAMTYTPEGKTLIVTQLIDDSVSYFDAETLEFERSVGMPQAPQSVICSPDGKIAYVLGRIAGILALVKLDVPGDKNRRIGGVISLPLYTNTMAMRDDGQYMYVGSDTANKDLIVIDLSMKTVVFMLQIDYGPYAIVFRK